MVKRADGLAQQSTAQAAASAQSIAAQVGLTAEEVRQETARAERSEKSRKSVYIYIATLFLVVLLFTLLSYFVQQRNNSEISSLHEKNATAQLNIENLQTANLQLQKDSEADRTLIAELRGQVEDLNMQLTDIRQQWQDEKQSLTESNLAAYNALLDEYNTLKDKYAALAEKYGVKVTDE